MTHRQGITLMEVLVAIMITGVGLLALLTLFPLGALEMAQSVKDDRCGHIKHNAAAIANMFNLRTDPALVQAMLNPDPGLPTLDGTNPQFADSVSYPVLVDPNGWDANRGNPGPWRDWVGGLNGQGGNPYGPRRMTMKELNPFLSPDPIFTGVAPLPPGIASLAQYQKQQRFRLSVFLDDIYFRKDIEDQVGKACPPGPGNTANLGAVERTARYSWAYLLQMPRVRLPGTVYLTVVVYSNRPIGDPMTGETAYSAVFNPGASTVSLQWDPTQQSTPDVPIGSWIMDGTMIPSPRGQFYRVVGATQTGPNTMDVEVLTPPANAGAGVVIIMENVVEVFPRKDF